MRTLSTQGGAAMLFPLRWRFFSGEHTPALSGVMKITRVMCACPRSLEVSPGASSPWVVSLVAGYTQAHSLVGAPRSPGTRNTPVVKTEITQAVVRLSPRVGSDKQVRREPISPRCGECGGRRGGMTEYIASISCYSSLRYCVRKRPKSPLTQIPQFYTNTIQ
jgi:hypothetical protein